MLACLTALFDRPLTLRVRAARRMLRVVPCGVASFLLQISAGVTMVIAVILILDMNGTFGGSSGSNTTTIAPLLDSSADFGPRAWS